MSAARQSPAVDAASFVDRRLSDRAWWSSLPPETRRAIAELHRVDPGHNWVALLFLVIWAATAAAMHFFPFWPVRIAGYWAVGAALHGLAALMHEGSHGNLFRDRVRDRWFAFFSGAPVLLSASAYRVVHQRHHRHLRTKLDPEEFTNLTGHPWVQTLAFHVWLIAGGFVYLFLIPVIGWSLANRRERGAILGEYGLIAALHGSLFAFAQRFGFLPDLLHGLVIPWAFVVAFTNIRGWAEHAMTPRGSALTESRVVKSTWLVSLLMCNVNYHVEHHLYPGMPWYNLRRLHALLAESYRKAGTSIYRSYLRFLWDAVRTGVHGVARGPQPDRVA